MKTSSKPFIFLCFVQLITSSLSCNKTKRTTSPSTKPEEPYELKRVTWRDDEGNVASQWAMKGNVVVLSHGSLCLEGCTKYYYIYKGEDNIEWKSDNGLAYANNRLVSIDITRLSKLPENLPKGSLETAVCRHCTKLSTPLLKQLAEVGSEKLVIVFEGFSGDYSEMKKLKKLGTKLYGVVFRTTYSVDLESLPILPNFTLLHVYRGSINQKKRCRVCDEGLEILDLKDADNYGFAICNAEGLKKLVYARINNNRLSPSCSGFLREANNLRYLDIIDNNQEPHMYLPKNAAIIGFSYDGQNDGKKWIRALAKYPKIKVLKMRILSLTPSCQVISGLTDLEQLEELRIVNIAEPPAKTCIRALPPGLKRLELITDIVKSDLMFLQKLEKLRYLKLSVNKIDGRFIDIISEMQHLEYLKLNSEYDPNELKKLKNIKDLRGLEIVGVQLSEDEIEAIESKKSNHYVGDIDAMKPIINEEAMKAIGQLKKLEELIITKIPLKNEWLKHLGGLAELRHLDLSKTRINGDELARLDLRKLEKLNLNDNSIRGDIFKETNKWGNLRQLLTNTGFSKDHVLQSISRLPELRYLKIDYAESTGKAFCSPKSFPKLKTLSARKTSFDKKNFKCLSNLKNAETLYLSDSKLDCTGVKALAKLKKLRRLYIQDIKDINDCARHLMILPYISEIGFDYSVSKSLVDEMSKKIVNGNFYRGY